MIVSGQCHQYAGTAECLFALHEDGLAVEHLGLHEVGPHLARRHEVEFVDVSVSLPTLFGNGNAWVVGSHQA